MEIVNNTPFTFASLSGRIGFPGHSLTLMVKATFDLTADGACVPAEEQFYTTGDELYGDDTEGTGSSRYESDFAYFKPRTDLLLIGKCHAPGNQAVPACQATFSVGQHVRTITVYGNRYWKGLAQGITAPDPFTEIDLRYENCYGGPGYDLNPVGKGYGSTKGDQKALPNIEDPKQLLDMPGHRPKPAALGPIQRTWRQRTSKLGTYGGNWLKERWPWFPDDFDWSYFNSAPVDMQVAGYLKGDESLYLENLHPARGKYHSTLPGISIRLFTDTVDPKDRAPAFREASMNLDTLWVDTAAAQLVLVWRGVIAVDSEDYPEVQHVFITSEPMGEPASTPDDMQRLFFKVMADNEKAFDIEPIEPEVDHADVPVDMQAIEEALRQSQDKMRAAMVAAGLDPPEDGAAPDASTQQEEAEILERLGVVLESDPEPHTRESVEKGVAAQRSYSGEDLSGLDLSKMRLEKADFTEAILTNVNFTQSNLSGTDFTGADLSNAEFGKADLSGAVMIDADLTGALLINADLRRAALKGAAFDEAVLKDANLEGCMANGTSFSASELKRADFSNAACQSADFSNSRMIKANFRNADLSQANLENATGMHVDMTAANLTGVRASGTTDLSMGCFKGISAPYSIWEEAILNGADFAFANLEGANFASASLVESDFSCADLKYARLSKSVLCQARCISVNLFQTALDQADLTDTDLRASNIYGAELLDATVKDTRLEGANLKMTKLSTRQDV